MAVASPNANGAPEHGAFVKKLASSSKRTREKGVHALAKWLSARDPVPEADLRKLWKGLFYCMWHTDKAAAQATLGRSFAALLGPLSPLGAAAFFGAFLATMRREWAGLDRLRMDKFYALIRYLLASALAYLGAHAWHADAVRLFMDRLRDGTLLSRDDFAALGVNLHLADIYIDELQRRGLLLPPDQVPALLDPFVVALAEAAAPPLLRRVRAEVFGKLLQLRKDAPPAREGSPPSPLVAADLAPVAARLFEIASAPQTASRNRKLLYEVHGEFARAARGKAPGFRGGAGGHGSSNPPRADGAAEQGLQLTASADPGSGEGRSPAGGPPPHGLADAALTGVAAEAGPNSAGPLGPEAQEVGDASGKRKKKKVKRAAAGVSPVEGGGEKRLRAVVSAMEPAQAAAAAATAPVWPASVCMEEAASLAGSPVSAAGPAAPPPTSRAAPGEPLSTGAATAATPASAAGAYFHVDGSEGYVISRSALASLPDDAAPLAQGGGRPPPSPAPGDAVRGSAGEVVLSAEALAQLDSVLRRRLPGSPSQSDAAAARAGGGSPPAPPAARTPAGTGKRSPAEQRACRSEPPPKRTRLVRFNLKGNLEFAKNGPVPSRPVRTPPSVAPRGSALKKGVAAGPVNARKLKSEEDISKLTPRGVAAKAAQKPRSARRPRPGVQLLTKGSPSRAVKLLRIKSS